MGVMVVGLGTTWSAGENSGCTWEHLGVPVTSQAAPATSLGALATSLGTPATSMGTPATSLGAPLITGEQFGQNTIFFGNVAGAPGNHSCYLSFNDY